MNALPKVYFCQAIKTALSNYVNFSGRSRRSEYWYFILFVNSITCILTGFILFFALGGGRKRIYYYNYYDGYEHSYYYYRTNEEAILAFFIILTIYISFIMIPLFAATVRRLHDIGKCGEYIFVGLVPFFGGITLLVLLCRDSEKGNNEFGPSPKYIPMDANIPMELLKNDYVNPPINNNNNYLPPPQPNSNYQLYNNTNQI